IGLETFAGAGKVLLPEVDRTAQHGFPDRYTGLQFAVQIDVRRFAENAGDGDFLSVYVTGRRRHLTAAAQSVADQFILVVGVLRFLPARNIESVAHCFQNGRLAAAPDADQRVQFRREMQRFPVKDAPVKVNAADVRCEMLGRLRDDPRSRIAQGKLDRIKGQFTQFEVTGFTLTDVFDAFGVAAFQFGGVPAT